MTGTVNGDGTGPATGDGTGGTNGEDAAHRLVGALRQAGQTLACAESLTAGLLTARVADVPGASLVLRGGIIAYAPDVKVSLLGVDPGLIERHGTVHPDVATAMAEGARRTMDADWAAATTGVAGPGPAEGHPAGTVWVGIAGPAATTSHALALSGDRAAVRHATVEQVLLLLLRALGVR